MKIATVRHTGRLRRVKHRPPGSTETYSFTSRSRIEDSNSVPMESLSDAQYFADRDVFEVNWTPLGKALTSVSIPSTGATAMLKEMKYQQKQHLAASLNLGGGGTEEDLNDRLEPAIEDLQSEMEFKP